MGKCEVCGSELVKPPRGRPQSRFCSRQCKDRAGSIADHQSAMARRIGRICAQCGAEIPLDRNNRSKTCSRACGVTHQNAVRAAAKRAQWEATKPLCGSCGGEIPSARPASSKYCSPECKKRTTDARWRLKAPDYMRQYLYGLSADGYAEMLTAQDDRCAICRAEEPGGRGGWHVDHDHATGRVRGLLCHGCNIALGYMRDDPKILRAAIRYLIRPIT